MMKRFVLFVYLLACLSAVWVVLVFSSRTKWSEQGNGNEEAMGAIMALLPNSNVHVTFPFRILCTACEDKMGSGSYVHRCDHFKFYAEQYYPSEVLQIDAVAPQQAVGHYNVTIVIKNLTKWMPELMDHVELSQGNLTLGDIFVDVLDMMRLPNAKIPADHHVVVLNDLQAKEVYGDRPSHLVHVVPHWFNSFAADAASPTPALPAPKLRKDTPLRLGLVWDPEGPDYKHMKRIMSLPKDGSYDFRPVHMTQCDIATWLADHHNSTTIRNANGELESIDAIAKDAQRGNPYLYQLLFRQYDLLLVLGKSMRNKKRYNGMQRTISQMRSGIPVLVECVPSQQVLCDRYSPSCQFTTSEEMRTALEQMKDITVRQACAQQGIEITKDYMPRKIIDEYLEILGFVPR